MTAIQLALPFPWLIAVKIKTKQWQFERTESRAAAVNRCEFLYMFTCDLFLKNKTWAILSYSGPIYP